MTMPPVGSSSRDTLRFSEDSEKQFTFGASTIDDDFDITPIDTRNTSKQVTPQSKIDHSKENGVAQKASTKLPPLDLTKLPDSSSDEEIVVDSGPPRGRWGGDSPY